MKCNQLLKEFEKGNKITVKFDEGIENLVGMFRNNMKADLVNVYDEDGCITLIFDVTKYYEYNKQFDIPTWYNKETKKNNLTYEEYMKQNDWEIEMIEKIYDNCENGEYNYIVI